MSKTTNKSSNSQSSQKLNESQENAPKTNEDAKRRHEATVEGEKAKTPWCAECFKRKKKKKKSEPETEKRPNLVKRICCRKTPTKSDQGRNSKQRNKHKKKRKDKTPSSSHPHLAGSQELPEKRSSIHSERHSGTSSKDGTPSRDGTISRDGTGSREGTIIREVTASREGTISRDGSLSDRDKHVVAEIKSDKSYRSPESVISDRSKDFDKIDKIVDGKDFTKTCCYLCAKNTLAIAAIVSRKVEMCDKVVQATCVTMVDKSVSLKDSKCPKPKKKKTKEKKKDAGTDACRSKKKKVKRSKPKTKRKKFNFFSKFRRTKCPVRKRTKCVTEENRKQFEKESAAKKMPCCKIVS